MFKELLKEIGIAGIGDLVTGFLTVGMMKKILLAKDVGSTPSAGDAGAGKKEKGAVDGKTPEVKFGGIFDNSDEEAFAGLIARMNADATLAGAAVKVSRFLNDKKLFNAGRRRKFRAVIGNLGRVETSTEPKVNLGVVFMKSFAACKKSEMTEICKAAGIFDSIIDDVGDGLTHLSQRAAQAVKKVEQSPVAQTVMIGLVAKMRAHRDRIRERQN